MACSSYQNETLKLAEGLADTIFVKVSNLSPFVVIPSPEGVKEKKPSERRVVANSDAASVEDKERQEVVPQKVIAISEHQEKRKKEKRPVMDKKKKRALDSYTKTQLAESEFLLKDNFTKKI